MLKACQCPEKSQFRKLSAETVSWNIENVKLSHKIVRQVTDNFVFSIFREIVPVHSFRDCGFLGQQHAFNMYFGKTVFHLYMVLVFSFPNCDFSGGLCPTLCENSGIFLLSGIMRVRQFSCAIFSVYMEKEPHETEEITRAHTRTCRYNEVRLRAALEEQAARVSGTAKGGREGGEDGETGGPEIGVPAIEVSKFGSNWQPLKRFRGRAGVEALAAS